ncbi:alpha/beta fold hydrolase [Paraburkholderia adhaesiva]|uniref:alpha/beta fold hydrolase n=1 Tax=Paraburkholderia adhaesiva TaxID=2883244 RepID=UPI001F3A490F|nr:alpha/beta fold hydrolase [Paraburkholderia adhaesiva]
MIHRLFVIGGAVCATLLSPVYAAQDTAMPQPVSGDFVAHDFHFSNGTTLPEVRIHYTTLGTLQRDAQGHATNAVLLLHGTTGTGRAYLAPAFQRELFAPGAPLDASRYFIVMPDGLGRGGSTKPSDGQHARFPNYGYGDVIEANHRMLVEGLGIDHLRLVLGTSMGGMQTWMWGERYPAMADALMPIASQPIPMAGRNWLWRQMVAGAIRNDPGWHDGDYTAQPTQWTRVMPVFTIMTGNAARMQTQAPNRAAATKLYDTLDADASKNDANDVLYWFESSWDYDPSPQLAQIRAPLFAVNFADDLINATDLGVMQKLVAQVPHGRYIEMPESAHSYGHQTLAHPEVWKPYLVELLNSSGGPG